MKISIVIPFFNRLDDIKLTLRSVKQQIYPDWECLLVDDGSTAEIVSSVKAIIGDEERIKFLSRSDNRKKGANACRNIGIENATGEYVALLDSDDEWMPERLTNLVDFIKSNEYPDGLYSGAMIFDGTTVKKRTSRAIHKDEDIIDFILSHETFSQTSTLVIKTDLGKDILFDEDLKRHQDFDFFIRFGNKYKWDFFDSDDVKINWIKGAVRNIDFAACITFYQKFRTEIDRASIAQYYLSHMGEKAVKASQPRAITNFYREALKGIGTNFTFRDKFMYAYPRLFVAIYKLKRSLK
jgi:glycosyltransferase involved in cell wall biosynthesis